MSDNDNDNDNDNDKVSLLGAMHSTSALYNKWDLLEIHVPDVVRYEYDNQLETIVKTHTDKTELATALGEGLYKFGYGYRELKKRTRMQLGVMAALALVIVILIIVIVVLASKDVSGTIEHLGVRRPRVRM